MIQCIDIVYTSIFMCIYYVYVSCVSREEPEYSEWKHSTHTHKKVLIGAKSSCGEGKTNELKAKSE